MVWVVGVVVLIAIVVAALVVMRRSARPATTPVVDVPAGPTRPEPTPMTDLEAALARVTDSDGRPIGERIDAETVHVDELRVPDDTGPLLRRALDHVAPADPVDDETAAGAADDPAAPA